VYFVRDLLLLLLSAATMTITTTTSMNNTTVEVSSLFVCGKTELSLKERLAPRTNLAPLLLRLEERRPEHLDYIGVSYGLTSDLLK